MLKLRQIFDFMRGKKPPEENADKAKEELFVKVARLKRLRKNPDFKEYIGLVEQYIDRCRLQKLQYNFAHAYEQDNKKTFMHAAFLDNDIDFAQRLLSIADDLIYDVAEMERQAKEQAKEEENAEV